MDIEERLAELAEFAPQYKAIAINAAREIRRLRKQLTEEFAHVDMMGHVIVEAGILPGIDYPCRCEACKWAATHMDDAGYMDDAKDHWWEEESEDHPCPK